MKADLEPLPGPRVFGYYARWRKDWEKLFRELAQGVRDVANLIRDAGSTQEHLIVMELSRTPYYFSD